jgi:hypothetical protein
MARKKDTYSTDIPTPAIDRLTALRNAANKDLQKYRESSLTRDQEILAAAYAGDMGRVKSLANSPPEASITAEDILQVEAPALCIAAEEEISALSARYYELNLEVGRLKSLRYGIRSKLDHARFILERSRD